MTTGLIFPKESKNSTLQSIIGKHEDTIAKLHSHVLDLAAKLSTAERNLVKFEMDNKHLKNVEFRLVADLRLLKKVLL